MFPFRNIGKDNLLNGGMEKCISNTNGRCQIQSYTMNPYPCPLPMQPSIPSSCKQDCRQCTIQTGNLYRGFVSNSPTTIPIPPPSLSNVYGLALCTYVIYQWNGSAYIPLIPQPAKPIYFYDLNTFNIYVIDVDCDGNTKVTLLTCDCACIFIDSVNNDIFYCEGGNRWTVKVHIDSANGATGPQGLRGYQGLYGPSGSIGFQGFQGFQGPTGSIGIQGPTGPIGLLGFQGPTGPIGLQGFQGPTGPIGLQGFQGLTGPIGIQGLTGPIGIQGPTGPIGIQGPTGPIGLQGFQGVTGSIGIQGPTGPVALGSNIAASYYSLTTQTINSPGQGTGTVFYYEQPPFYEQGVSLTGPNPTGPTQITVSKSGVYEAWYSVQLTKTQGGSTVYTYIWLRHNGVDVPDSNGRIANNSNNSDSLPIVPYIIELNAGDYIEFVSQSNGAHTEIASYTGTNNILGPNIPSIIVGIKEIAVDIGKVGPTGPQGPPGTVTGIWTVPPGASTQSFTVPENNSYIMWVNGNIPNGIITWNATITISNTNVSVIGNQYGWYYTTGNQLVLTSIPNQIVGTSGSIITTDVVTSTANKFDFGITNNSGSPQIITYGYLKL
jgi:hypothetical protein